MVTCYPQDGKKKSLDVCAAFAEGCRGQIVTDGKWRGGASMFYGIDSANEGAWRAAQRSGEDWYYADNAYFDAFRGIYFRVAKNRLQHDGRGTSDGRRFAMLGLDVRPWRNGSAGHVLVCPQSEHFMRVAAGYAGDWTTDVVEQLRERTGREIRVRQWNRDKKRLAQELPAAMAGAWALVTYSSGSAISAILAGIPAISTTECVARRMCGDLSTIEEPQRPERESWLNVVADNQWTLEEFRQGLAWKALQ